MSDPVTRSERLALGLLLIHSKLANHCSRVGLYGYDLFVRLADLTHFHIRRQVSSLERIVKGDQSMVRDALRFLARARGRFRRRAVTPAYIIGAVIQYVLIIVPVALRNIYSKVWLSGLRIENDSMLVMSRAAGLSGRFAITRGDNFGSRAESLKTILTRPHNEVRPYELLIWLVTHPCDVEEHIGDFFEMYDRRLERYGPRRALEWARRQALGIAWCRTKKIVGLITGISAFVHWMSRHANR